MEINIIDKYKLEAHTPAASEVRYLRLVAALPLIDLHVFVKFHHNLINHFRKYRLNSYNPRCLSGLKMKNNVMNLMNPPGDTFA